MKYLFLDDRRTLEMAYSITNDQRYLMKWDIVRNYEEFIKYFKENEMPEIISFDHDLGFDQYLEKGYGDYDPDNEMTGNDCAKWLVNYLIDNDIDPPKIILIHSNNAHGSLNIKSQFETYNKVYNKFIEVVNFEMNYF